MSSHQLSVTSIHSSFHPQWHPSIPSFHPAIHPSSIFSFFLPSIHPSLCSSIFPFFYLFSHHPSIHQSILALGLLKWKRSLLSNCSWPKTGDETSAEQLLPWGLAKGDSSICQWLNSRHWMPPFPRLSNKSPILEKIILESSLGLLGIFRSKITQEFSGFWLVLAYSGIRLHQWKNTRVQLGNVFRKHIINMIFLSLK